MQRALANVLRNAVKFATSRCEVRVFKDNNTVYIEIDDDGQGIKNEHRNRLFEPFFRGERKKQKTPGYGLGLSIAHTIIEQHGGQLCIVKSRLGGACFQFGLPQI